MFFLRVPSDLRAQRDIVYAEPDGERLLMTFLERKDVNVPRRPGMVVIHGGGWYFGTRYQQLWYCHQFARQGFGVMTVQYRMMPRYPFPHCLEDCKAAVRYLRLHADDYRIDPGIVVAFGASAGGHLAAFLAVSRPEDGFEGVHNPGASSEVQAALSLYGAVDLRKYRGTPQSTRFAFLKGDYVQRFAGDVGRQRGMDPLEAASPIGYIRPGVCPIYLVHGERDWAVHVQQSVDFHRRCVEEGVPTELLLFPNRDHGFDYVHWQERRQAFAGMMRFLNKHLGIPIREECL